VGVLALDLFFVPPRLAFTVADAEYVVTFAGLLVVGLVVSSLTAQARDQAHATALREAEARTLYQFSRDLARAGDLDEIRDAIGTHVREAFGRESAVLLPVGGRLTARESESDPRDSDEEHQAAEWALRQGEPAGRGTAAVPGASARYLPLKTARGTVGVIAIHPAEADAARGLAQRRLLDVFASVAALAVERSLLAEAARSAQLAQATEKLQSAIIDSISHDLRTPLVTITGSLTALEDDAGRTGAAAPRLSDAARLGLLTNARQESERLNRLVANLLDIARLEAGALRLATEAVDIEALIGSAIERLGDRLVEHPVTVVAPAAPTVVPMDASLMTQVLVNLLDNAAKHGPQGSPLQVRVASSEAGLSITVEDEGPGVPDADLGTIFDKFHRLQRPGGPVGTGLGLAVCKGIVEAHGGRIAAHNRRPRGLAVEAVLPLSVATGVVQPRDWEVRPP
jgi:two-component system sensor histidine kinase KdpD